MVADIAVEVNQKDVFLSQKGHAPSPDGINDNSTTDLHFAAELNLDVLIKSLLNRGLWSMRRITEARRRCTLRHGTMLLRRQRYC